MARTVGRAPTHPKRLLIAVNDGLLERVDAWRAAQPGISPNRSEAVRYLIEKGIEATTPPKPKQAKKPRR
ncbi:MAG: hypothetical protein WBG18_08500 [Xanthobacteraceae bacterium]